MSFLLHDATHSADCAVTRCLAVYLSVHHSPLPPLGHIWDV